MATEVIQDVPLDEICAEQQVREEFDDASIAGLAQTIRQTGLLQPLRVRKDNQRPDGKKYVIVDGERRYRAYRLAGVATIPVIVELRELSPAEILQKQLIANCQREDLNPIEKAQGIDQFIKAGGCTAAQVATKIGMSNQAVTRAISLLTLPAPLREHVRARRIPVSAAYELTRIDDPESQAVLAAELIAGRLTRDGLTGLVRAQNKQKTKKPKPSGKCRRATASLKAGRSITVVGDNLTLDTLIESLEELLVKARKARPQGLALGTFLRILKDTAEA